MKALISPNDTVRYISGWYSGQLGSKIVWFPTLSVLENANRVCEVKENEFEVAPPMHWVDCANDVTADNYYYDTTDSTIKVIPNVPEPVEDPN